jgi:hypothetical protein
MLVSQVGGGPLSKSVSTWAKVSVQCALLNVGRKRVTLYRLQGCI